MISSKKKDLKIRKLVNKTEKLKKIYKFLFTYILNRKEISSRQKETSASYLLNMNTKLNLISKTKIVNRCVFTNRGRGNLRPWGISRTLLRDLMQCGLMPGYSKAVW